MFCSSARCEDNHCQYAEEDKDGDGFMPEECGGQDCNDLNPNTHPAMEENCFDADDNDCNGVADCLDPACEDEPECGCIPDPAGENCTDGIDNDCDTTVDCNDTDCFSDPACGNCTDDEVGLCTNGLDDDCDGATDCDDPDCEDTEECVCIATPEQCANGEDDDCDLLIDCADSDCELAWECNCDGPPEPEVCDDNIDNDCDQLVDCADSDCASDDACEECTTEICDDGIDNDCDNIIDCADDACFFDPACPPSPEECANGLDDDHDGLIDCNDPDCSNNPVCQDSHSTCDTARLIHSAGSYTGDTSDAENLYQASCGGMSKEDVFYFTLTEPSRVVLDTDGSSIDTLMYVRKGSCEDGKELACDDDGGGMGLSSRAEFAILYPGTYYVFIDAFRADPDAAGPYVLNVSFDPRQRTAATDRQRR